MGLHVVHGWRHLFGLQMAHFLARQAALFRSATKSLAGLFFSLGRNGCGGVFGRAPKPAKYIRASPSDNICHTQDCSRDLAPLRRRAHCPQLPCRGLGRDDWHDFDLALWLVRSCRDCLADCWHQCQTDHECAVQVEFAQRILGAPLERRFQSVSAQYFLPPAQSLNWNYQSNAHDLSSIWAAARVCDIAPGRRWLWPANRVFPVARLGRDCAAQRYWG